VVNRNTPTECTLPTLLTIAKQLLPHGAVYLLWHSDPVNTRHYHVEFYAPGCTVRLSMAAYLHCITKCDGIMSLPGIFYINVVVLRVIYMSLFCRDLIR
jgi:hypothetical protein